MAQALMNRNRRQQPPQLSSDEIRDRYSKIVIPEASIGTPEIKPEEIEIVHAIGDGSSGTVYKGRCRQKDVAVKILQKQNLNDEELQNFRREIEILSFVQHCFHHCRHESDDSMDIFTFVPLLRRLRHPNIVLFMGACTQVPGKLMIVTELMNSDLQTVLDDAGIALTLLQRMKMAKDITLGLNWLHSNKPAIIHRDLNPSNLLVDNNLHVKIADYGLSKFQDDDPDQMVTDSGKGTPYWMAPEILMNQSFSEKSDVYSFGIVMWQLLTRQEPFNEFDDFDTFYRAVCDENIRPFIPSDTHPSLRDLITDCWEADYRRRPPFASIVKRLDHIIVDCAISDPHANIFWKERFLTKDEVRWRDFVNLFGEFICLTTPGSLPIMDLIAINHHRIKDTAIPLDIRCLKAVLGEPPTQSGLVPDYEEEVVHLERFGQVCDWFGPLKSNFSILERVRNVLRCGWFHGDISTQEAENRLMLKEVGTFLVRFSTSAPGAFTISKVAMNGQIHHQRISKVRDDDQDWFVIATYRFTSLIELIDESRQPLVLLIPCTGSKYFSLFTVQQEPSGYIEN